MPAAGGSCCFGYVQTYDSKPKRRLFEVLAAQGMQPNQQVTFLTDGGDDIRDLPRYLNPQAEHLLDWFLVEMSLFQLDVWVVGLGFLEVCGESFQRVGDAGVTEV